MTTFHDVEVHNTDEMNRALADNPRDWAANGRHPKNQWAIVYANGVMAYYPTEEAACAAQREWRRDHGRNPITGE